MWGLYSQVYYLCYAPVWGNSPQLPVSSVWTNTLAWRFYWLVRIMWVPSVAHRSSVWAWGDSYEAHQKSGARGSTGAEPSSTLPAKAAVNVTRASFALISFSSVILSQNHRRLTQTKIWLQKRLTARPTRTFQPDSPSRLKGFPHREKNPELQNRKHKQNCANDFQEMRALL